MTGGELIGGANAAASGLSKAVKPSAVQKAALLDGAKDSPEFKHAAQQHAYQLAVRQTLISKMYAPIARLIGMRADYFDEEGQFQQDMAKKTAHLDDDELVEPRPNVAAQAMQGLGWSLEEPQLKEMYLNLLATASTKSAQPKAHPAFAEIIRQLTAEEADALVPVLEGSYRSICRLHRSWPNQTGESVVVNHVLNWPVMTLQFPELLKTAAWVDNWIRLGMIEVDYARFLTAEGSYDWMEAHPLLQGLRKASNQDGVVWGFDRGALSVTSFGGQFRDAVVTFEHPTGPAVDAAEPGEPPA